MMYLGIPLNIKVKISLDSGIINTGTSSTPDTDQRQEIWRNWAKLSNQAALKAVTNTKIVI